MTRPNDIPEDVWATATGIAADIPARVRDDNRIFAAITISRAILAERQRCADVASKTYAKDAFHFELGTAAARAILGVHNAH